MVILFGKPESSFSVHYIMSREKMTSQPTDYPKADVYVVKNKKYKIDALQTTVCFEEPGNFLKTNQVHFDLQEKIVFIHQLQKFWCLYFQRTT